MKASKVINNSTVEILKLFLGDPTREYTMREVSRITGMNYRLAYENIKRLEEDGTVLTERKGQSNICRINLSGPLALYSFIESIRAVKVKSNPQIKVILESLDDISTSFYTLIVFGSYSGGKQTKKSDIDLLFIIPDNMDVEKFSNEVENSVRLLSYKIDINVLNESDFVGLKTEKRINLFNQVLRNHMILHGAENYYRMIS